MTKKSRRKEHAARTLVVEAREARERARQRKYWTAAAIIGAVLGLILIAAVIDRVLVQPGQPVAMVDGRPISTDYFQKYVRLLRAEAQNRYLTAQQQLQQFGDDPTMAQFKSIIQQNAAQAQQDMATASQRAYDALVDAELVKAEAATRGVTTSDAEVQTEIDSLVAQGKGWLTVPQATAQAAFAITATATAQVQPTATPSPTPTAAPSPTASTAVTATTPTTATTDAPQPTPTPQHIMTGDEYKIEYQNLLTYYSRIGGFSEEEYRQLVRVQLLQRKLQAIFANQVETDAEQIHLRHLLVDSQEKADAAMARLKAGEVFTDVAKDVSIDTGSKDQGGDLGWAPRGTYVTAFEDAAFALTQPGQLSAVVPTQFGFHIIQLVDPAQKRPLEASALASKRSNALRDFLTKKRSDLSAAGKLVSYYSPAKDPK
ncbi:MAG: peptidylprolyl isomerase [Chloroflexi bacterium]|nr:peptidylprolyl isomerase [Chloroflexota bacterium]